MRGPGDGVRGVLRESEALGGTVWGLGVPKGLWGVPGRVGSVTSQGSRGPWEALGRGLWASSPGAEPLRVPAGVKEDTFKVLDLAEYTKNRPWWRKVFAPSSGSSAEKYNVATQLLIGGVTGW